MSVASERRSYVWEKPAASGPTPSGLGSGNCLAERILNQDVVGVGVRANGGHQSSE